MQGHTRLVTWNCNHQLGRKLGKLLELAPDVAVIQECERDLDVPEGFVFHWVGDNPRKGLGVLSRDSEAVIESARDEAWTYFLPVRLPAMNLRLLATWAFNFRAQKKFGEGRTGNAWDVISALSEWLQSGPSLVAGDFNNNVNWDTARGRYNFADIVDVCSRLGLRSAYHAYTGEALGAESQPTFLHTKNPAKPFHIDYCFASRALAIHSFRVEPFDPWLRESDHVPLILDLGSAS